MKTEIINFIDLSINGLSISNACQPVWAYFIPRGLEIAYIVRLYLRLYFCVDVFISFERYVKIIFYFSHEKKNIIHIDIFK